MHQTSQNIYNNLDQWIITSVTLQNDALNSVISILRKNLEEHKLIDENNEIHNIEMDDFEKKLEGNDDEKSDEIGIVKPIDNNSICGGRVYNKINIDYLIKDEIMDIKVEEIEIKKNENNEKNNNANENNNTETNGNNCKKEDEKKIEKKDENEKKESNNDNDNNNDSDNEDSKSEVSSVLSKPSLDDIDLDE